MTWNRRNRFTTVLLTLLSLLFMQLAMAGYSCSGGNASKAVDAPAMAQADIPCSGSMNLAVDDAQPSLCAAHCKSDPQTADNYQVHSLPTLAVPGADFPLPEIAPAAPPGAAWQAPLLRRSTAASLAVRNCCFRL
ncbi:MAG: hypothetical protein A3E79_13730 [Burkholderiales bacterium RIFCSPHIGHO2_12_FULL_61_11]|nr:MAG: hypothetical protein A3E79_13730 [Burkholderiales bacterium RIFCSPHIGHO2_12_FULL_61_11]